MKYIYRGKPTDRLPHDNERPFGPPTVSAPIYDNQPVPFHSVTLTLKNAGIRLQSYTLASEGTVHIDALMGEIYNVLGFWRKKEAKTSDECTVEWNLRWWDNIEANGEFPITSDDYTWPSYLFKWELSSDEQNLLIPSDDTSEVVLERLSACSRWNETD